MHKTLWRLTLSWAVVGIVLVFTKLPLSDTSFVNLTISIVMWPKVLGIVIISAVLGNLIFSYVTLGIIKWMRLHLDPLSSFKASWLLTIIEIMLYSLALVAGVKELVAVWLAFKAVSVWSGHTGTTDIRRSRFRRIGGIYDHQARSRYNIFLFNNAMRLGWGFLTYAVVIFLI